MKTEICSFSLHKIYPGRGIKYARIDSKVFQFSDRKNKCYFLQKQKAAKFGWTLVYRKLHKKGQTEATTRKRGRRVQRVARSIEGTSLDILKKRSNQKPEERQAARDAALKELKKRREVQKAARKERKSKTVAGGAAAQKAAAPKQQKAGKGR